MARKRNILRTIRTKLAKSTCRAIDVQSCGQAGEARAFPDERYPHVSESCGPGSTGAFARESGASTEGARGAAAVKIQTIYRGHLARRALRALRGLVRLQALVRGFCVRQQLKAAMQCMLTLVRLQLRVRTRQFLGKTSSPPPPPRGGWGGGSVGSQIMITYT